MTSFPISTGELLEIWGFPELIPVFQENRIEPSQLAELLEGSYLEQLVPQIGYRIALKKAIQEYAISKEPSTSSATDDSVVGDFYVNPPLTNLKDVTNVFRLIDETQTSDVSDITICSASKASTPIPKTITKRKSGNLSVNLTNLLNSTCIGKAILSIYELKSVLDNTCQAHLVDIICTHFLNGDFPRLTNENFDFLASSIIELFPNEVKEVYFTPPIKKRNSRDNKSEAARGKLIDKYRNKLTFLRRAKILPGRLQDENDDAVNISTEKSDDTTSFVWLKTNIEPWSTVIEQWKNSYQQRLEFYQENISLDDIYKTFPALLQPAGFNLIEQDFALLYQEQLHNNLLKNWDATIENLINLKKSCLNDSDRLLLDIYKNTANLNEDYKHSLGISLLASLIPSRTRYNLKKKEKEQWKPTITESKEGVLIRVEIAADVQLSIDAKKKKMKDLGLTVQPFLIIEGNASTIKKVYAIINDTIYIVPTVLGGLDLIFKAFHVFKLRYPIESEHLWMFIQLCCYKLKTKWDSSIPSIIDLVNKVQRY